MIQTQLELHACFHLWIGAKGSDTAHSDIDVMVIGETLAYVDAFSCLAQTESRIGRAINQKVSSPDESKRKLSDGSDFLLRALERQKNLKK